MKKIISLMTLIAFTACMTGCAGQQSSAQHGSWTAQEDGTMNRNIGNVAGITILVGVGIVGLAALLISSAKSAHKQSNQEYNNIVSH